MPLGKSRKDELDRSRYRRFGVHKDDGQSPFALKMERCLSSVTSTLRVVGLQGKQPVVQAILQPTAPVSARYIALTLDRKGEGQGRHDGRATYPGRAEAVSVSFFEHLARLDEGLPLAVLTLGDSKVAQDIMHTIEEARTARQLQTTRHDEAAIQKLLELQTWPGAGLQWLPVEAYHASPCQ